MEINKEAKSRVSLKLRDNKGCFACGSENPFGMKMQFRMIGDSEMESEFLAEPRFQGFQGILHGGIMALLLDEVMVNLAWKNNMNAVSADLNIRLRKAVRIGDKVILKGRIQSNERKIVRLAATAKSPDGTVYAEAKGVCVKVVI